jgi:hypothetical protein
VREGRRLKPTLSFFVDARAHATSNTGADARIANIDHRFACSKFWFTTLWQTTVAPIEVFRSSENGDPAHERETSFRSQRTDHRCAVGGSIRSAGDGSDLTPIKCSLPDALVLPSAGAQK